MMKMGLRPLITLLSFFALCVSSFAADKAARAIIVKGDVSYTVEGKTQKVKRNQWLPEGAEVETQKGSFAKLMFIDRSSINVGPASKMKIETFPQDKAGIISLVKGKIRSKVTKNYMNNSETDKSKLFIKTKTAAMGVRGTDFQVSFNEDNDSTSLVTFEGAVAMGQINGDLGRFDQSKLESIVSSTSAVMVRRGQFSGASPKQEKVTAPTKISPVQLETLEKNEVPGLKTSAEASGGNGASNTPAAEVAKGPTKKYRSIVPPGMDAKEVANTSSSLESAITQVAGPQVSAVVAPETAAAPEAPTLEAAVNLDNAAPKPGGFVDIETAQYIQPPEGSVYDANAEVYTMDADQGYVDASGNYANDFYDLNANGEFVAKEDDGRSIASVDDGAAPPPPPPEVMDGSNPQGELADTDGPDSTDPINSPNAPLIPDYDPAGDLENWQNSDNNQVYGAPPTTNVTVRPVVQ